MIIDRLLDLERKPAARSYNEEEYDLGRYEAWLDSLGTPQSGQRFLHLAGTKGKGSTAAICEALLLGLGFPTALYSSPHIEHFGERYRSDGEPWTLKEFEQGLQAFYDHLAPEQRRGLDGPHPYRTVFEMLTALALVEFRARGESLRLEGRPRQQAVVWETGLGGRLDCTNVVDPVVSVITTLGMDHIKLLGNTIEEIAAEKAGIIKPGRPVIVGRQDPQFFERVWPVISRRAEELGAPLIRAWEHNPVLHAEATDAGQRVTLRLPSGREASGILPLRGGFQLGNLEAAVAAVWYFLKDEGLSPEGVHLLKGLERTNWPGRLEVHRGAQGGLLLLDGAHCPLSARALGREVSRLVGEREDPRFVFLFGMQRDKDAAGFLENLLSACEPARLHRVITCPIPGPRGAGAEGLARSIRQAGYPAKAAADPESAVGRALETGHAIVAAGTLYTLGTLRAAWKKGAQAH